MHYLKYHRLNLGLTQTEIAKKAKISQGTYCDYENGHKRPRPRHHLRLAEVLERPVEELTSMLYKVDPSGMSHPQLATK